MCRGAPERGHKKAPGANPGLGDGAALEGADVELFEQLLEDLAALKFDHGALGNDHFGLRLVRIAADARFAALDFQHSEVAQLDVAAFGEGFHDDIERHLDGGDDFLLGEAGLLVDLEDDLSFSEVGRHGKEGLSYVIIVGPNSLQIGNFVNAAK